MKAFTTGLICCFLFVFGCEKNKTNNSIKNESRSLKQYITILGIAQDAGYPQINCFKSCCRSYYDNEETKKMVSCLGLIDKNSESKWLFDATPDIVEQTKVLRDHVQTDRIIDGIFLTHAHIGHYTGLMHLGREALGGKNIPVFAMPRMKTYLEKNGPWDQLVKLNNIKINQLENDSTIHLDNSLKVTPFLVPHRDEYSETVGYKIEGNNKSALFIPDIDKWETWERSIIEEVKKVDYAFLDASFFRDGELERDMSKIPHPFTTQTTSLFQNESKETKAKIYFIHFNHTNPTIKDNHPLKDSIQNLGFNFAKQGDNFEL
ncbi:MBL fold metallo-hydrolase [Winogradskyella vincentii]|uniref:MBL fold metallo-hydrolase n=1 Tax=Winogradskyella vincentii TaxID=2877122 RepID=A0ABS7Y0Z6_9FLAO|nr:MBL fold metallo-hydrolase [Winogradskyella vincentii]MCA0153603.1 MBL fold metallo-hydrolase [Winogradskyella vincentii]